MVSSIMTLSVLYPHLPTLAVASSSHSQQQWWEIPLKLNQMALLLTETYWIDVYFSGLFNIWEIFCQSVFNITGEKCACATGLLWFIWVILKCFFILDFISRAGTEYDYLKYCCITVTMNTSMFVHIICYITIWILLLLIYLFSQRIFLTVYCTSNNGHTDTDTHRYWWLFLILINIIIF